jgi:glycosyltransferase involved in cell wall biosynthesis
MMPPKVSVVIPCRNEEAFIGDCLASIVGGGYPDDRIEVLVVDGMSNDGTRAIVAKAAAAHAGIRLLDNPDGATPVALNIGVRHASGDVIAILGAHSIYPPGYFSTLVQSLVESGADGVGGVCVTRPAGSTAVARAIAAGVSHRFGVGNSYFRIGADAPRWVDTVPFGVYRRDIFDRVGLFDEDLVRNQDDEFNGRVIRGGGRLLLVPSVKTEYFARGTIRKLWRMYYQYGYFKPLAARKIGRVMTVRQLLPPIFAAGLIVGAVLAATVPVLARPFAAALTAYVVADAAAAAQAGWRLGLPSALWLTIVFPTLHLSYGLGSLHGLADFVVRNRRPDARVRALTPSR